MALVAHPHFVALQAAHGRCPAARSARCRPIFLSSTGPAAFRRRTVELSLLGAVLAPAAALADGGAQAGGLPAPADSSAAAAVAEVMAAVKAGAPVDTSFELPGTDSLAGGRRAGGPECSLPVAEASQQSEHTEVDSGSDSESDSDSSSSSSSSCDEEGEMARPKAATRLRKPMPADGGSGGGEEGDVAQQAQQQAQQREQVQGELRAQMKADKRAAKEQRKGQEMAAKAAKKAEKAERKMAKEAERAQQAQQQQVQQQPAAAAQAVNGCRPLAAGEHSPSELAYPRAAVAEGAGEEGQGRPLNWLLGQLLA